MPRNATFVGGLEKAADNIYGISKYQNFYIRDILWQEFLDSE